MRPGDRRRCRRRCPPGGGRHCAGRRGLRRGRRRGGRRPGRRAPLRTRPVGVLVAGAARPRALAAEQRDRSLGRRRRQCRQALERAAPLQQEPRRARAAAEPARRRACRADPRAAIATTISPRSRRCEVGGDWHDAFHCSARPCRGRRRRRGRARHRGRRAMGQLRSATRALAGAGLGGRRRARGAGRLRGRPAAGAPGDPRLRRARPRAASCATPAPAIRRRS